LEWLADQAGIAWPLVTIRDKGVDYEAIAWALPDGCAVLFLSGLLL
jgi:hypothetical protein